MFISKLVNDLFFEKGKKLTCVFKLVLIWQQKSPKITWFEKYLKTFIRNYIKTCTKEISVYMLLVVTGKIFDNVFWITVVNFFKLNKYVKRKILFVWRKCCLKLKKNILFKQNIFLTERMVQDMYNAINIHFINETFSIMI